MSVRIKDMKMPESCGECPMFEAGTRHWREGRWKEKEMTTGYCWAGRFVIYMNCLGFGYDDGTCPLEEDAT